MLVTAGSTQPAHIKFSTTRNRKLPDIPAAMTLPVDRYVDVYVTGNEIIGVESDEPLHVLRQRAIGKADGEDDDSVCADKFQAVEHFQPQISIRAFLSALDSKGPGHTTVWLLINANLLKSDRLSVDETDLLKDYQLFDEEPLEILGVNYTAVQLTLTSGYHVVSAVSDATPQLALFEYIYVPEVIESVNA